MDAVLTAPGRKAEAGHSRRGETTVDAREQILEVLRKAYQIEVDGHTFYAMTAEKAGKPAVKELFQKLADDEVQHQAFLRSVGRRYDTKGTAAFAVARKAVDLSGLTDHVFTARFKEQAKGAAFEMGALSVGLTLETNAMAHFNQAASAADSTEVREFYQFLADWEKQHFDALNTLYTAIRADFWGMGGFAPF
jgi:rubrerythrin